MWETTSSKNSLHKVNLIKRAIHLMVWTCVYCNAYAETLLPASMTYNTSDIKGEIILKEKKNIRLTAK